jgi:hypothetical protein
MAEIQNPSYCPVGGCGCVGYAYVPVQVFNDVYGVEESLCNGTIFPELHLTIKEYGVVCKATGGVR